MKIEEIGKILGYDINYLNNYSRKYIFYTLLFVLADIACVVVAVGFLFYNGTNFSSYLFAMILIAIALNLVFSHFLNGTKWDIYKKYRHIRKYNVEKVSLKLTEQNFIAILYAAGNKRYKTDMNIDYYKELSISFCCEDVYRIKKFAELLLKYKAEDGNVFAYIATNKDKNYFVDFVE